MQKIESCINCTISDISWKKVKWYDSAAPFNMIEYISTPWSSKLSHVINKVTVIAKQF